MKLENKMYLCIQFGKAYKNQLWIIDLQYVAIEAGGIYKISRTQVKRLIDQGGIKIGIIRNE